MHKSNILKFLFGFSPSEETAATIHIPAYSSNILIANRATINYLDSS